MGSFAGTTLMGSQPVAGSARSMHVCVSQPSNLSHAAWLIATKPAARMFVTVPDAYDHRRPRGTT